MSVESLILSHAGIAAASVAVTLGYLRHVAGWRTNFEASIAADLAQLRSLLHLVPGGHRTSSQLPSGLGDTPVSASPMPPVPLPPSGTGPT